MAAKVAGGWRPVSWSETARSVRRLSHALRLLGLAAGDRVALVAENGPDWVIADLAIMAAGGITVPAYTNYTIEDYRHVLTDSSARFLILGSAALARRVLPAADQVSGLEAIIAREPVARQSAVALHLWDEVLAAAPEDAAGLADPDADDTACLIYTSGTGGPPKGVMLTHRNMMSNARGARTLLEGSFRLGHERFLSFLPLTHSYEHTAGFVLPVYLAAEIWFTNSDALIGDLKRVRPTIVTAVPRLFEMLHKRLLRDRTRRGRAARYLSDATIRLGRARLAGTLGPLGRLADRVLDLLVRRTVRRRFGGRLKVLVSGGAPLNPEIARDLLALGVPLIQGYGQTETGPVVGVNPPNRIKPDTVGPPLEGVEIRIATDGEILIRGPNVMKGYWRDPEATLRTIVDGWLHTGDIGRLDTDNYLQITERKRDFIKTSGGDMVAPQKLEGILTMRPGIAQAHVHGDRHPYLVALIVPDRTAEMRSAREVSQQIANEIAVVNAGLPSAERIRRHAIIDEPFSVENGQMTPTLKLKRHVIRAAYASLLSSLYDKS